MSHDLGIGREGDHRDLGLLGDRSHGEARAGAGGAEDQVDLLGADQLVDGLGRTVLGGLVVLDEQLDLAAVDAALGIHLLREHLEGLALRDAEAGSGAGL